MNIQVLFNMLFPQLFVQHRKMISGIAIGSDSPGEIALDIYSIQRKIFLDNLEEYHRDLLVALSCIQRILTQTEIYYSADIGERLKIYHGFGLVIGARVRIGSDVTLYQNVTIGEKGKSYRERPIVEDGVIIYAGAVVIGGITLGANSIVAANAVVHASIPANSIVAGVPAKIIGWNEFNNVDIR